MAFDPVNYLLSRPELRFLLGVTGCPGAGKSTFAADLASRLGPTAIVLPMDGFHYSNTHLDEAGLRSRKGAPDTYDGGAFVALLRRLRDRSEIVKAPLYSRVSHEPEANAIAITPSHRFVLVEGNYLLVESPPWGEVAGLLDETWFLDVPSEIAEARLRERHISVGRSETEADLKVQFVDMPNGEIVLASRGRADRWISNG